MKTFTDLLDIEGNQVRLLFSPVITKEAVKYFVTVADQEGGIANFEMKEARPAVWKVLQPAPRWVLTMETKLSGLLNSKNNLAVPAPPGA